MGNKGSIKPTHLLEDWLVGPLTEPLTQREREILVLLDSELSVREMAEELTLAVSSVKWHIQQIYGKLGVNNRRQAITRAREFALLDPKSIALPVADQPAPRHNLPAQLSSFIGRKKEIPEICQLIRANRLVTLSGSGGAGKTRLALHVGQRLQNEFPDGVWFVDLTPLTDPALLAEVMISAMKVRGLVREKTSLYQYLEKKSLLMILDNCEHLVEACAHLSEELLRNCPSLHILATSREALGVAGEETYRVPPLTIPDPKNLLPLEELAQIEAVQLFVERARSAERSFELTESNALAVAQIGLRLDGIPLAIELAAARLKVMTAEQIAGGLDDTFNLLTSGSRTALPRHQTLRALIEWSYDLLSDAEQAVFRKLSVFSGGWSLEAAEGIFPSFNILDFLSRLVNKSLVIKEERGEVARFRMLETIRQYADARLAGVEEEMRETREHHAAWFLAFAAQPPGNKDVISWAEKLETEHDNLRATLAWLIGQEHREKVMRLVNTMGDFWNFHGHDQEGYHWTEQALSMIEEDSALFRSSGWAMTIISLFLHTLTTNRDIKGILSRMVEASEILRKEGKWYDLSFALRQLGLAEGNLGLWESAERHFQEALKVQAGFPPDANTGFLLLCLGVAAAVRAEYAASREYYRKSLETDWLGGDNGAAIYTWIFCAEDLFLQGQLSAAGELNLQAVKYAESAGMMNARKRCLVNLGRIYLAEGKVTRAREWASKAFQIEAEYEGKASLVYLSQLDLNEGRLDEAEAKAHIARDWASSGKSFNAPFYTEFHANLLLGRVALLRADALAARGYLDEAQRLYTEVAWYKDDLLYLLTSALAHITRLERCFSDARRLYTSNLSRMQAAQHYLYMPENLEGLAMVEVEGGQLESAARLLGTAQRLRHKMGAPLPSIHQAEYDVYVQRLRQGLGEADFAGLWNEKRGMTVEEAIVDVIRTG